jgi:hypothetical protein
MKYEMMTTTRKVEVMCFTKYEGACTVSSHPNCLPPANYVTRFSCVNNLEHWNNAHYEDNVLLNKLNLTYL